jgi:hypothetical protein
MSGVWRGVRWDDDIDGFQLRCEYCERAKVACWWPLTREFWNPEKGMTRCRACWNAKNRSYGRRRGSLIPAIDPKVLVVLQDERRRYKREWAARDRANKRMAEGRARYERRKAA